MGAKGSTGRQTANDSDPENAPLDYYQTLEVAEDATADEIKRSFRRLALIHHPDKNHADAEEATKRFATLQQAYEILSDEQERAWYDSHRSSLIPEADSETVFEDIRKGHNPLRNTRDRGLTVRHLAQFFETTSWNTFDDGENSFFTIYRNLFSRLSLEESNFGQEDPFPSFGTSTWSWTGQSQNDANCAKTFYNVWLNFATEKDFVWVEQWNLSEAPERRVRRLMEKDNKKLREDARKEYNETVRSLVKFIRKRDPRYKKHLESQSTLNNVASSSTPKPAVKVDVNDYVEQDWQKVETKGLHADLDWAAAEGEDLEEWECVACRKTFHSEPAWNSHERSKKHLKEVERLKREMEAEDEILDLEANMTDNEESDVAADVDNLENVSNNGETTANGLFEAQDSFSQTTPSQNNTTPKTPNTTVTDKPSEGRKSSPSEVAEEDPEPPSRRRKARRRNSLDRPEGRDPVPPPPESSDQKTNETIPPSELSKKEKRRAKQQAKQSETPTTDKPLICNVCGETFPSRTKLFGHLAEKGHANEADKTPKEKGRKQRR